MCEMMYLYGIYVISRAAISRLLSVVEVVSKSK